jgi:hypothetical protein
MRDATKGSKPAWFTTPKNLVGVNVCRLSGLLPNDGCDAVEVVSDSGEVQTRSMIYTEYFVRGKEPTELCPLHGGPGVFDRLAGVFGKESEHPVSADAAAVPPAETPRATSGSAPGAPPPTESATGQEEPKKKKRGFWSRMFGLGKDNDAKNQDDGKNREKQPDQKRDR